MKDLKQQFQEETNLSFEDIYINGVHLEYINWLEKRIEELNIVNEELKAKIIDALQDILEVLEDKEIAIPVSTQMKIEKVL